MTDRTEPPLLFIEEKNNSQSNVKAQSFYYSKLEGDRKTEEPLDDSADDRPKFKDFDLEDKFKHLKRLLLTIPQMNCEIMTEEKSFNGMIKDITHDSIRLKPKQSSSYTIPKNIIQDIRLIGL